jgi:hypothetical protein
MDLKAMGACYNSVQVFCHWFKSSSSTPTYKTVEQTATPKVATFVSIILLDLNLILSDLNTAGVFVGSNGIQNSP